MPPLLLLSGLERWAARWGRISSGGQALKQRNKEGGAAGPRKGDPTSVAVDATAGARRQSGVGVRFAVEVEPQGKHNARAAVAEDDLGRLAGIHRAQHRPWLPGLHLLRGVRFLLPGLLLAALLRAVLLSARLGYRQVPGLLGTTSRSLENPGLRASGFADAPSRKGRGVRAGSRAGVCACGRIQPQASHLSDAVGGARIAHSPVPLEIGSFTPVSFPSFIHSNKTS